MRGGPGVAGAGRPRRRHGAAGHRDDAVGHPEQIAVLAAILAHPLRRSQPTDLLHAAPRPAGVIRKASEGCRDGFPELPDQSRHHANGIPQQGTVRREMDVRLDHGGIDPELGAVLETERDRGLDHGVVEGAHRGGREAGEGPVERVVLGDGLGVEGRKAALELPRFRGHISSEEEGGVHDAKDTPTIFS